MFFKKKKSRHKKTPLFLQGVPGNYSVVGAVEIRGNDDDDGRIETDDQDTKTTFLEKVFGSVWKGYQKMSDVRAVIAVSTYVMK